jgi:hypothetical protein
MVIPTRFVSLALALCAAGAVAAGDAAPAEPPAELDPIEVSAEKRAELAFRAVQLGLERSRSDRVADQDLVVCIKETPTGSHRPVVNCATNRKWAQIRSRSLAGGLSGLEANGGPGANAINNSMARATGAMVGNSGLNSSAAYGSNGAQKRADDVVLTLPLTDYNKLKARYGELPPEMRAQLEAESR